MSPPTQRAPGERRHVLFVFGKRPEAIKLVPVILRARRASELRVTVCTTGQHREMLDQVLRLFGIEPVVDLRRMKANQTLAGLTGEVLAACSAVFERERPDLVIVHGDTSKAFAASLAAFYARVPVAYIEAGLRTGNFEASWSVELYRRLTAVIARLHFAPTVTARENLLREGVDPARILVTATR